MAKWIPNSFRSYSLRNRRVTFISASSRSPRGFPSNPRTHGGERGEGLGERLFYFILFYFECCHNYARHPLRPAVWLASRCREFSANTPEA